MSLHKNTGIIFNIPIPIPIVIIASLFVISFLIFWSIKQKQSNGIMLGSLFVIIGALGNLIDRIQYGFTIDYLILFGRSAINLADILIFIGIIWLFITQNKRKNFDSM